MKINPTLKNTFPSAKLPTKKEIAKAKVIQAIFKRSQEELSSFQKKKSSKK